MARNICDNCGAVVSGDQFCPTCGAWVDQLQSTPSQPESFEPFSLDTTPPETVEDQPVYETPPAKKTIQCPSCGNYNPIANRHCEECGALLARTNLPIAPRPVLQSTAGTRAAMALAGLLVGVFALVFLWKSISADDPIPSTTTPATTTTLALPVEALILHITCSIPGYATFECSNLETAEGEYQFNWHSLPDDAEVTINIVLGKKYKVSQIVWVNLADATRHRRNYRAKTITISDLRTEDLPTQTTLSDLSGEQVVPYISRGTSKLVITIDDVFQAETIDGNVYPEFALQQIKVLGYEMVSTLPEELETTTTVAE